MVQVTPALLNPWLSYCLGRRSDYAIQQEDGRYLRVGQPVTYEVIMQHLQGLLTMGTYVITEQGLCRFVVYDCDLPDSLSTLSALQSSLAGVGVTSYPELSRRSWHLWAFFAEPMLPVLARRWLLPYCPPGVEFYPKQDQLTPDRPYGSIIRLPLGVHRLSGLRYPFVRLVDGVPVPLAPSLVDLLALFPTFERVPVSVVPSVAPAVDVAASTHAPIPFNPSDLTSNEALQSIRDWCLAYDPLAVIGRYVALDQKGMGCCPFGWHHADGADTHPSFYVYRPSYPDVCCWYCHVWQKGGSLFDFLRYYYGLEARDLWSRLLSGAHF